MIGTVPFARVALIAVSIVIAAGGAEAEGLVRQVHVLTGHGGYVNAVAIARSGNQIATASDDKTARLWDAASGKTLQVLSGHTDLVRGVAISPDETLIATASSDRSVRLWDAKTGKPVRTLSGHTDSVVSVEFSGDGARLVSSSWDKTVRVWDIASGSATVLTGHGKVVTKAVFTPDGKTVLSSSQDQSVRVWDVASARQIATVSDRYKYGFDNHAHPEPAMSVAVSTDGRFMVSAGGNDIKVWNAHTRERIAFLQGHRGVVDNVVFAPGGQTVLSASWDNTAKLWDWRTGRVLATLGGHTNFLTAAAFTRDGRRVVTASRDKTARIWDVSGVFEDGRKFDQLRTSGSARELFLAAAQYESQRNHSRAKALYSAIVERFANDDLALKAAERLAVLGGKPR